MAQKPAADFQSTFDALRKIITPYELSFDVVKETPKDYYLASKTAKTRSGAPVWFGGVSMMKNYVSFHLIPVYASPTLAKTLSPDLKKRMQGKSCFNFTTIQPAQLKELAALTKTGFTGFTKRFP